MAEIVIKLVNGELAGKTMQEVNKQVRESATALQKAKIGTDEWVKANNKLSEAKDLHADMKKQIDATTVASGKLKDQFFSMIPFGGQIQSMTAGLSGMRAGVGGLINSMGLLKTALISTGLGALVVLLGSLVAWFTKTERGGDFLAKSMAALGAVMNVVIDRASKLIDALIALFSGDFEEAANKFGEATSDVTAEIIKETKAAWDLAEALDALEELEGKMILTRARMKDQIAELRLEAKNDQLTMKERAAALEQAIALTQELTNKELEIARGRAMQALGFATEQEILDHYGASLDELIQKGEELITVDNLGLSESTQEDLDGAMTALAELFEVQKQGYDEQRTIQSELIGMRKKDRAAEGKEAKAAADAAKKLADDAAKAEEERIKQREAAWKTYYDNLKALEDGKIAVMEASREKDIAALKLGLQRQIEALDANAPFYAERVANIQERARQARKEINDKWDAQEQEELLAKADLELATIMNSYNEQWLNKLLTDEQYRMLSEQALLESEQRKLDIIKSIHGETSKEYQDALAGYLDLQRKSAEDSVKIKESEEKMKMQAATGSLGMMANTFGQLASMQAEGSKQAKDFLVAQAIMSTILGAVNAYTSTAQIPYVGAILAPIAAGVAFAAGMANVNKIRKEKVVAPTKKELGGPIEGPRHSGGGVPIEAEGGEFIFSRKAVAAIGMNNLARINDFHTRKFEMGGPVNPFQDRAPVSSRDASVMDARQSNAEVVDELRALRAEVAAWPTKLQVVNDVTQTEEKINVLNQIRDEADV